MPTNFFLNVTYQRDPPFHQKRGEFGLEQRYNSHEGFPPYSAGRSILLNHTTFNLFI